MQEVAGSSPAAATVEYSAILLPDLSYQNVWLQDLPLVVKKTSSASVHGYILKELFLWGKMVGRRRLELRTR